jgi:hypothetical protein
VAGAADRWGRDESKAQFQWWGAGGRWVSEAAQRRGGNRRFKLSFKPIQKYSNGSNEFWIPLNFGWFKRYLPALQKFEIKYGWKAFEIRINCPYRNVSRFKMEFELKFREISMGRRQLEIH